MATTMGEEPCVDINKPIRLNDTYHFVTNLHVCFHVSIKKQKNISPTIALYIFP